MGKAGQAESRLIGKDGSTEAGEAIEIDQPELGRAGEEDITEVGLDQAGADEISLAGEGGGREVRGFLEFHVREKGIS